MFRHLVGLPYLLPTGATTVARLRLALPFVAVALLQAACGEEAARATTRAAARTATALADAPVAPLDADAAVAGSDDLRAHSHAAPPGRWLLRPPLDAAGTQSAIESLEALGYTAGSRAARGQGGARTLDAARVQPGLNLVTSGHAPEALLIDLDGRVLHTWRRTCREVFPELHDADAPRYQYFRRARLMPDGGLLAIYEGTGLVRLDRDSKVLWRWLGRAHHDFDVWPDGRIVVLSRRAHVVERLDPTRPVSEEFVVELSPDGQELSRVSLLEALEATLGPEKARERLLAAAELQPGDILHSNTLQLMTAERAAWFPQAHEGDVLVSLRNQDLIGLVDRAGARFGWLQEGTWRGQHQPELGPDGRMLLFDNQPGTGRSHVLEIDPSDGHVTWSWSGTDADPLTSDTCGSVQRLDNGNVLVVESDGGRAFEVTRDGTVVWRFDSPWRAGAQGELVAALFDCVRLPPAAAAALEE